MVAEAWTALRTKGGNNIKDRDVNNCDDDHDGDEDDDDFDGDDKDGDGDED